MKYQLINQPNKNFSTIQQILYNRGIPLSQIQHYLNLSDNDINSPLMLGEDNLKKGLNQELAKKIVADIKNTKLKVQASIQGEQVRVSGKSKDDLQAVIALLRENADKYDYPLQFQNYR